MKTKGVESSEVAIRSNGSDVINLDGIASKVIVDTGRSYLDILPSSENEDSYAISPINRVLFRIAISDPKLVPPIDKKLSVAYSNKLSVVYVYMSA